MLNGKPIRDWDFLTRAFNMVSPIQFNLDQGPGRQFLFDSGYDMRMSTYYSPDGHDLTDSPKIRSMFQKAIGDTNLERKLDKLAQDPKAIASLKQMQGFIRSGQRDLDYLPYHQSRIKTLFDEARKRAWASIMNDPAVIELIEAEKRKDIREYKAEKSSRNISSVLSIYK